MLGYLKKFNNLPAELRQKVSSPEAMAAIAELEKKYQLALASLIMRVMVREIALNDLVAFLLKENLTASAAKQLAEELKNKIFFSLGDYFREPVPPTSPAAPELRLNEPAPSSARAERAVSPPKVELTSRPEPLAQARPKARPQSANFFFSPDDEREIRELAERIDLAEKTELTADKIEEKLRAIIDRTQINFGSADLASRFKQILKTYLRGIRNRLETELTLTKPFLNGGLSFDEDSAQKVMAMTDKILHPASGSSTEKPLAPIKLPDSVRLLETERSPEKRPIIERDAPYDFSLLAKEKSATDLPALGSRVSPPRAEDLSHELAPLTPVVAPAKSSVSARVQAPKPLPRKPENKVPAPRKEPATVSQMPLIRRRFEAENLNQDQKIKVEDVKYVPKVMSPLDEIKYLNLVNFRRLDKDPQKAVSKIKDKIALLEEEGYDKKLASIKFWRSSPLNRLYLEIGHLSISGNKPVDVIIEERKMKAGDYLTAAEFEAIMDLNKSLRF